MESDYLVALRLQQEIDKESLVKAMNKSLVKYGNDNSSYNSAVQDRQNNMSLVDEAWEVMDPNPDIRALFLQFNDRFFWGRLAGVEVRWSPRMTLCAGLCCYEGRAGYCSVRLSQPLLKLRPRKDLIETLLHEMIHAYLFVTDNNRDHDGHGPEFHKHMYRINGEAGTSISVYHNFHDEVEHHRQHWWRCDGVCRSHPPYFGYVKRSMNRAPHPRDPWWPDHQRKCGGTYTKVKEPENYKKKEKKDHTASREQVPEKATKKAPDIRKFFGDKSNDSREGSGKSATSISGGVVRGKSNWDKSEEVTVEKPSTSHPSDADDGFCRPMEFPGKGFKLETQWTDKEPHKIVRKLPGIGVIECERPTHPSTMSCADSQNNKKRKFLSSDTDSDTDDILDQLRAKAKSGVKLKKNKGTPTLDDFVRSTPGKSKRIHGFQSVCSGNDSKVGETSKTTRNGKPSSSPRFPIRERDRRAISLGSDSSESDEGEENLSLHSAVKAHNNSNSDPDFSPTSHRQERRGVSKNSMPNVPKEGPLSKQSQVPLKTSGVDNCCVLIDVPKNNSGTPDDPLRTCPSCMQEVKESQINSHLDACLQMF